MSRSCTARRSFDLHVREMEIDIDEDSGSYLRDRKQLWNNGNIDYNICIGLTIFAYNTLIMFSRSKIEEKILIWKFRGCNSFFFFFFYYKRSKYANNIALNSDTYIIIRSRISICLFIIDFYKSGNIDFCCTADFIIPYMCGYYMR